MAVARISGCAGEPTAKRIEPDGYHEQIQHDDVDQREQQRHAGQPEVEALAAVLAPVGRAPQAAHDDRPSARR